MTSEASAEKARDPQQLERLLVSRQRSGDIAGMVALFEAGAVVEVGEGRLLHGHDAIRAFFEDHAASGGTFQVGVQQTAVIAGGLALTSTRLPDGTVTAEVARQQPDGTWLWIIDRYTIARER
jgi:SnoaL-like domain